jgi:hypothetical protein
MLWAHRWYVCAHITYVRNYVVRMTPKYKKYQDEMVLKLRTDMQVLSITTNN